MHSKGVKEVGDRRFLGDVIVEVTHNDYLFMIPLGCENNCLEVLQEVFSVACLYLFGQKISALLLIDPVVAIRVGFACQGAKLAFLS